MNQFNPEFRTVFQQIPRNKEKFEEEKKQKEEIQKCLEERKQREQKYLEEELKHREEERIRLIKEGKLTVVESLFVTRFVAFGKRIYVPRVDELIEFLQSKENAIEFWQNPHVKMIYNVSNYFSFLVSIYAEETDNKKHENWLRTYFSNPFTSKLVENYELFSNHQRLTSTNGICHHFDLLKNYIRTYSHLINSELYHANFNKLIDKKFIVSIPSNNLIEQNTYKSLAEIQDDEVCFLNPFKTDEVCFVNPLYVMDNNFLRLDTYYVWKDRIPKAWIGVKEKKPIMFKILDALVSSRKTYCKWINK